MGSSLRLRVHPLDLPVFFAGVRKNQVPFAAAVAMTRTVVDALGDLRGGLPKRFTVRSTRTGKGISSFRANKKDWPKLVAGLGVLDEWLARHEEGGVQTPTRGSSFAVPTRLVASRRTGGGAIPKRLKPRELITMERARRIEDKIRSTRHVGSLRGEPLLFLLRRRIHLEPRLEGRRTLERVAQARMMEHFERELTAALKSERMRANRFTSSRGRFFYRKARGSLTGKGI